MTNLQRTRKPVAQVVTLAVVAVLVFSGIKLWRLSPYKVPKDIVGSPQIVLSLMDVDIAGRDAGKPFWSFRSKQIDVSQGRIRTTARGIQDGQLYNNGKLAARVTAGTVEYSAITGNVAISGGVQLVSPKGYQATGERALWTRGNDQLRCSGKVSFKAGDSSLSGRDLVADIRTGEVTLSKGRLNVTVEDLQKLEGQQAPEPMDKRE